MIDKLKLRRDELRELFQRTSNTLEQLRGAIAVCDQLIEDMDKPNDVETVNSTERQLPS
jgi:hypothetical protein